MRLLWIITFVLVVTLPLSALGQTQISTLGGNNFEYAGDMAVAPGGDLLMVGAIHEDSPLPEGVAIHTLVEDIPGAHRGFVARYSADGQTLRWLALFPADTFVPSRVAADEDVIALTGDPLAQMTTHLPPVTSEYNRGAVVVLSADGERVIGARGGPPNTPRGLRTNNEGLHTGYQAGITGLSIYEGLIYATGSTSGSGQGAYIVRYDVQTLEGVDFPGRPDAGRLWAIDLRHNTEDLVEKLTWRYDVNHENAEFHQGDCRINLAGNRRGGQVVVTDFEGGTIFGSFDIQYDFNCTNQWFPAFDAGIAAWTLEGELKWATNGLDQMVSEPDQGPRAMVWDPIRKRLVVALWQHGSNVARLPGTLTGDTGNISIGWVGVLNPADGAVESAWYQHAVRENSNGSWSESGGVNGWPQNSGNTIHGLAIDSQSRVIIASSGGNRMFTTAGALQDWPEGLWGAHATITVLSPDLEDVEYATVLRRGTVEDEGGSVAMGVAVNSHGLFVFGRTSAPTFHRIQPEQAPWQSEPGERENLFLARIAPEDLPFEPSAAQPGNEGPAEESGDEEPGDEEPGDEEPGDEEPGDEEPGSPDAGYAGSDVSWSDSGPQPGGGNGLDGGGTDEGCACASTGPRPSSMFYMGLFALGALWVRRLRRP